MAQQCHWDNLVARIYAYGQQVGGFGSVTLKVQYHEGLPVRLEVLERNEACRLDIAPSLPAKPAPVIIPSGRGDARTTE